MSHPPILTCKLGPLIDLIEFDIPPLSGLSSGTSRPPKYISASRIKACSRQWFYALTQNNVAVDVMKEEWKTTAAYGILIHDQIQRALLEYEVIENTETWIPRVEGIAGRIDGRLKEGGALLEIKTMSANHWRTLPYNDKFDSYQDQIQTYLEILDLPEALLVCVRREPIIEGKKARKSLCKEYIIKRDRNHGQALIAKAILINEAIDRNIVPPAEPSDDCAFCPFQQLCQLHDIEQSIELQ